MTSEINTAPFPKVAQVDVEQNVPKPKRAQAESIKDKPIGKEPLSTSLADENSSNPLNNQLDESSEAINTALFERTNQKLKFSEDEKTGKMIIQIVDKESEEVIRQIPPQQFLNLIYNINKVASAVLKDLPRFV